MNLQESTQVRELCEKEIVTAIKRYEQLTDRKVTHVNISFKKIPEIGKIINAKIFDRPENTLHLELNNKVSGG